MTAPKCDASATEMTLPGAAAAGAGAGSSAAAHTAEVEMVVRAAAVATARRARERKRERDWLAQSLEEEKICMKKVCQTSPGSAAGARVKITRMGLNFRSRKKTGKNSWINFSGKGASASKRMGPVTVNSRGGFWVNLPGGFNFRGRWRK